MRSSFGRSDADSISAVLLSGIASYCIPDFARFFSVEVFPSNSADRSYRSRRSGAPLFPGGAPDRREEV